MYFDKALEFLKHGYKIKRKPWDGYWVLEKGNVMMYFKDGQILDLRETKDTIYTLLNIVSNDWEVMIPEDNLNTFCFGSAIEFLKKGEKLARKGWNGKGIFIKLQYPDKHSKMTHPYIYIDTTGLNTDNDSAPKNRVPWLASQTDMLSNDWIVV